MRRFVVPGLLVLASALPGVHWIRSQGRIICGPASKVGADLAGLDAALERWRRAHGAWPAGLEALVTPDGRNRTFLQDLAEVPLDPWGRPYRYALTPEGPLVYTLGADGEPRGDPGDGDRANWWRIVDRASLPTGPAEPQASTNSRSRPRRAAFSRQRTSGSRSRRRG